MSRLFHQEVVTFGSRMQFRPPRPVCAMYLAALTDKKSDAGARIGGLMGFLEDTLSPDAFQHLMDRAYDHDDPYNSDDMVDMVNDIIAAGSARPYWVDTSLCGVAVRQWPMVRGRLVMNGIADPLRDLPTLYALLDVVEQMLLEGMPKDADRQLYFTRAYSPPSGFSTTGKVPPGFSAEEEMEAWESARG